jgi:hypothetical protein
MVQNKLSPPTKVATSTTPIASIDLCIIHDNRY